MIPVSVNGKTYQVPNQLHELSRRTFLRLLPWLDRQASPPERTRIAWALMPWRLRLWLWRMSPEQRYDLVEALTRFLQSADYTRIPLRHFRVGLTRYYLPSYGRFSTIEAAMAQRYAVLYQDTRDVKHLNALVATLCRPKRLWLRLAPWLKYHRPEWDGDERIRYNSALVELETARMNRVPLALRLAVYWHFCHLFERISKQFPDVFAGGGEQAKPVSLIDLLFTMSGTEFGTMQSVAHQPFVTTLTALRVRTK